MATNEKTDILLAALNERYEALRIIRTRVQDIAIWTTGIFFGASGWLISSHEPISWLTKGAFLSTLSVAFFVIRFLYLSDLAAGFKTQQAVAARIENALGLYDAQHFGLSESIYPIAWKDAGRNSVGNFFKTNFALIYVATTTLCLSILLKGMLF